MPKQDPIEVVNAIVQAVESGVPFKRIPVGRDSADIVAQREARTDAEYMQYIHERAGFGIGTTESMSRG